MIDEDIDLSKDTYATKVGVVANVPVATATAIPMMAQQQPTFSTSNLMTNHALSTLRAQGFPLGLAQELGNTKAKYPIRYWIVDNSGYVLSSGNSILEYPFLCLTFVSFFAFISLLKVYAHTRWK
jgi:hypothetical protein